MHRGAFLILNNPCRLICTWVIFTGLMILVFPLVAQVNYVPNPGFEEVSNCDLDAGEADKAQPWKIVNAPIATPDLFHSCSTSSFFTIPTGGCDSGVYPKSGEGMVGLVSNLVQAEERIYARLIDDLPQGIDIYVAYAIRPREKCGGPMDFLCYSNSLCLAFSDFQFQSQQVVLESDTIIDAAEEWIKIETCYAANGTEDFVLLGNYKETTQTLVYCDFINATANFTYTYVDEVIVSPFDVVPDTVYLCEGEVLDIDATFFEVPISWNDGWEGGERVIEEEGLYTVFGEVESCFLTDKMVVIKIPDEKEITDLSICEGAELTLEVPLPAVWENGDTSNTLVITRPGNYTARLLTACGNVSWEYFVEDKDCAISYYVPNVFSPNRDGVNDDLTFFFQSDFDFSGELHVFDRWGNMLFRAEHESAVSSLRWDGTFKGKLLGPSVVVWVYRYVSAKDGKTRTIAGDVMIVK